jgi:8-oxo-dGTP diphosphatase
MTIRPAKFCPHCGSSLGSQQFEGRERRYCENCAQIVFQQPMPAAGVAVVDESSVLLIRRMRPPFAETWAIPAGVMEHDEKAKETAVRELREETNVVVSPTDLVFFDTWQHERPDEDIYSVTIGYAVSRTATTGNLKAGSDAGDARFWELDGGSKDKLRPGEESKMKRAIEAVRND